MTKKHHDGTPSRFWKSIKKNLWLAILLGIVASVIYFVVTAPRIATTEFESTIGLHYHPHITITVNGENVPVPKNIGISTVHNPIHTHEDDNIIHLEFEGAVKKSDIVLGKFFDIWGQEWTATSFMGYPIDATHTLTMNVDGVENTEYRNLLMKDKQEIELIYQ
jgi:hypothetical protein